MVVLLAFLVCVLPIARAEFAVTLNQTDVKFLRNDETTSTTKAVAWRAAVDEQNNLIYAAGVAQIDVLRYNGNLELEVLYTNIFVKSIISIQVCDGYMSILNQIFDRSIYRFYGFLDIFSPFNTSSSYVLEPIKTIQLSGYGWEHHAITQDCKKYIIAMNNNVGIISFDGVDGPNYQNAPEMTNIPIDAIKNLDEVKNTYFRNYDTSRFSLRRISINTDETRAYVSSAVNNAMVTIDLMEGTAINVTGMGVKDWSKDGETHGLDCSDDGVINITNVPLFTFIQPFDIQSVRIGNDDILLTVNTGYSRENEVFVNESTLENNAHLQDVVLACPRLRIEDYNILTDANQNGEMDKIIGFGGRGMSLFNATDFQIIADTKSAVEESVRDIYPLSFNQQLLLNDYSGFDYTSDMYGPPFGSSAAAFVCDNQRLVTIAGGDMLYVFTVDVNRIDKGFQFHGLYDGEADRSSNSTFKQLYDDRLVSLKGIYSLKIIKVSPEKLMLVASGRKTGTINVFEIVVTDCPEEEPPQTNGEINMKDGKCSDQDNGNSSRRSRKNKNKKKGSKNSDSSGDDDDDGSKSSRKYKNKSKNKRKGSKNSGSSEDEDESK